MPIDYSKLIIAVNRTIDRIGQKSNYDIIHFIHSIDEKNQSIKNITLHHNGKVFIIDLNEISYISALRGYCEIITTHNQKLISSKSLSDYEELLRPMGNFLRVNKSTLINIHHILNYTKGSTCFIDMKHNKEGIEVSRRKKTEIVQFLKNWG